MADGYGPSAGWHAPPDQGYVNHDAQRQGQGGPQHTSYDPQTGTSQLSLKTPASLHTILHSIVSALRMSGLPIPPGYVPPNRPPPAQGEYFPPPPRQEYNEDHWPEDQAHGNYDDRSYDRAPQSDYGQQRGYTSDRPYAPSDPYGHEGNQIAPYEEEKAEAEQRRAWDDEQRRRQNVPYPPSDYEPPRDRFYDDRSYDSRDDRYDDRRRRYDRDRYSDDISSYDSRDRDRRDYRGRDRDPRRRDSRHSPPSKTGKDFFGGKEGQRGLSAQILGGAAGGLAGHELGGSILETLGGVVVGAMGAKVLENQYEKRKDTKEKALRNTAPFKDDAVKDRRDLRDRRDYDRIDRREKDDRDRRDYYDRDDRTDYGRDRSRTRSRGGGGRGPMTESEYSDDYSPPPPRR